jgi:hypothetical protein
MKIINPRTIPCGWCKGDKREIVPHCWGCGHWAILWQDETGQRYWRPFDHEPRLDEVIAALVEFHADVTRYRATMGAALN